MTNGAPFTNMRKDHPSQKEKVQLQVMNFVKEGSYRSKKEEENKMIDLSSQNKIKNGNTFNGYCFSCHSFDHKVMDCKKLEKGYSRKSKTQLDVGDVIFWGTHQNFVIQ